MRLVATFEPPGAMVMFGTVVIETVVVVSVSGAEWLVVVVLPVGRQGVAGVATVAVDMETVVIGLVGYTEVVVFRPEVLSFPVLHFNPQHVVT